MKRQWEVSLKSKYKKYMKYFINNMDQKLKENNCSKINVCLLSILCMLLLLKHIAVFALWTLVIFYGCLTIVQG